ncbi:hypothetical protein, partial [uncultured Nostoc sp.]|uniref:hypothetical protein n=1 Tax=uncultured Nostoc sp. TaxID=340711 RepID=UPI0035CBF897
GSGPGPGSGPNPDPDSQECERQAEDVIQQIQETIQVMTDAQQRWPSEDLGPVTSVLGSPTPSPDLGSPTLPPPPDFPQYRIIKLTMPKAEINYPF